MTRAGTTTAAFVMAMSLVGCGGNPTAPSSGTSLATPLNRLANNSGTLAATAQGSNTVLTSADRALISFIVSMHLTQIELGGLAEGFAERPMVKFFGRQMVQDHTVALENLREMVGVGSTELTTRDEMHQGLLLNLSDLGGSEFDDQYMDSMVDSHMAALTRLRQGLSNTSDWLREHANEMIEGVMKHLNEARDVDSLTEND
jgi:putative membrane protein